MWMTEDLHSVVGCGMSYPFHGTTKYLAVKTVCAFRRAAVVVGDSVSRVPTGPAPSHFPGTGCPVALVGRRFCSISNSNQ